MEIVAKDQTGSIDVGGFDSLVKRLSMGCNRSCFFFSRDPFEHPSVVPLVEAACQFGDKVTVESPLCHNGPALVSLLKHASCSSLSFLVPFSNTNGKIQFPRFLGRVLLIAERGFEVTIVDECGCADSLSRELTPHGIVVMNWSHAIDG